MQFIQFLVEEVIKSQFNGISTGNWLTSLQFLLCHPFFAHLAVNRQITNLFTIPGINMAANAKDQASFTSSEHQVTNAVQQQDVESAKAFNESDIEDMNMQVQEMTVDRETYSSEYAGVTPGREKERRLRRQSQEKTTVRTRRRKKMSIYKGELTFVSHIRTVSFVALQLNDA